MDYGTWTWLLEGMSVPITLTEAAKLRDAFFRAYSQFRRWQKTQSRKVAGSPGMLAHTRLGRPVECTKSVEDGGPFHYTRSLNVPIQGSCAEALLEALAALPLATWARLLRPWFVCAAATRALPSEVRGPVDLPPCSLHRLRSLMAGFWQGVPLRVLARHLWPGRNPAQNALHGRLQQKVCC